MTRARDATGERISIQKKVYDEAKVKRLWGDKAVETAEDRVRPLAEAAAHAEAEALYRRASALLTAPPHR